MIKRPRDFERSRTTDRASPPMPKTPQLMLPPPPERGLVKRILSKVRTAPGLLQALRAVLFLTKVLSLMLPCSPYTANPWLLYPLLGLAAIEAGMPRFEVRRALLFSALHITFLALAFESGRLCQWQSLKWEDL